MPTLGHPAFFSRCQQLIVKLGALLSHDFPVNSRSLETGSQERVGLAFLHGDVPWAYTRSASRLTTAPLAAMRTETSAFSGLSRSMDTSLES